MPYKKKTPIVHSQGVSGGSSDVIHDRFRCCPARSCQMSHLMMVVMMMVADIGGGASTDIILIVAKKIQYVKKWGEEISNC